MPEPEECRRRIVSEEYRDFIITRRGGRVQFPISPEEGCVLNAGKGYDIVYVEQSLAQPLNFETFTYNSVPQCYTLLDMEAMDQAGITPVQNYPTLNLRGEGIMLGFIDSGIDYENAVFRNIDGSTRIVEIWDQTDQTGALPEEFGYGSVYNRQQIDEALRAEDPLAIVPTRDVNGHGTFVASVAAGGGDPENQFLGAAPESAIAVVKLKEAKQYLREFYFIPEDAVCYQENDIMLAIRYLWGIASTYNMPLVLCLALGTNMGGHNGSSPLEIVLELYAHELRRGIVTGVGNEANQRHHYQGELAGMDTRREVEIRVGTGVTGFIAELWTDIPNIVTIALVSPSGEQIPSITIKQGRNAVFRFLFEQTEVTVDYRILAEAENSQLIFLRFDRPVEGIWKMIVEPVQRADGTFHAWLPVTEFLAGEVYFLESNPDTTLMAPSSVSSIITAAWYNGSENSVAINSGRGYTRSGRIKPDIAAPGVNVLGALPGGRFVRRSGSSVAAGIVAGATALLLEWVLTYVNSSGVDTLQLRNLFVLGATQRDNMEYPNREWGYGTLDLYEALNRFRQL